MRLVIALLATASAAGCALTGPDGGFGEVKDAVGSRTSARTQWLRSEEQTSAAREQVKALLAKPLMADDAVQIALVNNPGLQASYAELGIAGGDLVSSVLLPNPRFSYLRTVNGDEAKVEAILSFNILSLVTVPLRWRAQEQRFEQVKRAAAAEAVRVAGETRKAYYSAIGAAQLARYMEDVKAAAEASAELAQRMAATGNFSKLDRMREQVFYADATAQLARARRLAFSERERLLRLMGLWGEQTQFRLPERMPDLPATPRDLPNAEQLAIEQRLDLQAARHDAEATARSLGLTRVTRFVDEFDLGLARTREDPEPTKKGYEIGVRIPLFDWGSGRVARAEALYLQAANRVAATAINARSEVRDAYAGYRTSYDLSRHYRDEIVPVRKQISEEVVLRYNGMLASVFELLADAREQVAAVSTYIDHLREFWIADADLQTALVGGSPGAAEPGFAVSAPGAAGRAAAH